MIMIIINMTIVCYFLLIQFLISFVLEWGLKNSNFGISMIENVVSILFFNINCIHNDWILK